MIHKFIHRKVTSSTNSNVTEETTKPMILETLAKTTTSNLESQPFKNIDIKKHKPSIFLISLKKNYNE